ncbi:hypothetical protein CXG81DRAFT_3071, partial [Caulochytrium protostelioides]
LDAWLPSFPLLPGDADVLTTPADFYARLLAQIRSAEHRLILASLYLGAKETALVDAVRAQLQRQPQLQVVLLLDGLRGTRSFPPGAATSVDLLAPLAAAFPDRVQIGFYQTPALTPLWKRVLPARLNETLGLQHMKYYLSDASVTLSGANLNHDYFTDRQDRYITFRQQQLCDYFDELTRLMLPYCYTLAPAPPGAAAGHVASPTLQPPLQAHVLQSAPHHKRFVGAMSRDLANHCRTWAARSRRWRAAYPTAATWLYPSLQMAPYGIEQDAGTLRELMVGAVGCDVVFSSGYFNPVPWLQKLLVALPGHTTVLTAAPEANGFFNSAGYSRFLPAAYTSLQIRFLTMARSASRWTEGCRQHIHEWRREGWTYHAKGLWLHDTWSSPPPPPSAPASAATTATTTTGAFMSTPSLKRPLPFLTVIGSSNYGARSLERDLEAQVVVWTRDPQLQQALRDNLAYLDSATRDVTIETMQQPYRRPHWLTRCAARVFR